MKLIIAGTPINGNYNKMGQEIRDYVLSSDFVIGEDRKYLMRFLAGCDARDKEYELLNEHSTDVDRSELLQKLKKYNQVVLISDAGTPAVADPGTKFIDMCYKEGVEVISCPGPSSITTALSVSGFDSESFVFMGFPPREKPDSVIFYKSVFDQPMTAVVFERPYALNKVMEGLKGIKRRICICVNLGFADEEIYRGYYKDVASSLPAKLKKPFVVVVEGN